MAGNYWIKFYVEILDDPKMATLPDRLWRRFYELCLIAGKQNKDGLIPPIEQIAWLLRIESSGLQNDISELVGLNLITETDGGYLVTNFSKRQEKMSDAERTQKFRDEKRKEKYYCNDNVTEVSRPVTQITDNRIDNREETEQSAATAPIPVSQFQTGESFYITVFSRVTGMTAIPGNDMPKVLAAMDGLRVKYRTEKEMIDYLQPYYDNWKTKRTKAGLPYSKSNCAWLYDMAVAGDKLPTDKSDPEARPDPSCPKCGGIGMVASATKDIHDKNFGRLVKCDCLRERED